MLCSRVTLTEQPAARRTLKPEQLSRTLKPGDPDYDAAVQELTLAEEHAIVDTALLWRGRYTKPQKS